ncbi:MAG TPA: prephenate/arogenate dehydrogenase family protein [Alphaproteobacteria bacterium]|nr:prephenate/arogenate dehydrogenase family protein [Alphaproteobacteria bacterium]
MTKPLFERVAIIGFGLIGSSLGRAIRAHKLARTLVACDRSDQALATIARLRLADAATPVAADAAKDADLVVIAVPLGAYAEVANQIAPVLKPGAIVSDVGSVKGTIVRDLSPILPPHIHLVPGHPVAGTENSGPESGFETLFEGRWCILTPPPGTDPAAIAKVTDLWLACGAMVETMDAAHHDKVLAITSHVPHLIAYTIVGTASNLEEDAKSEVIKFSASGFRDFTRIAASDPTMWRDIFLNNKEAVLEMLQRLTEDLTALQRAIRRGEGDMLFERFTRTREIRRRIIDAHQA